MPVHYGFDFYYGVPNGEDENDFVLYDHPTTDSVGTASSRPDTHRTRSSSSAPPAPGPALLRLHRRTATRTCRTRPPAAFVGRSGAGAYGDTIQELDAYDRRAAAGPEGPRRRPEHARHLHERQRAGRAAEGAGLGRRPLRGGKGSCEEGGDPGAGDDALAGADPARARGQRADQHGRPLPDDRRPRRGDAAEPPLRRAGPVAPRHRRRRTDRRPGRRRRAARSSSGRRAASPAACGRAVTSTCGRASGTRRRRSSTSRRIPPSWYDLSKTRPELASQLEKRLQEILAGS